LENFPEDITPFLRKIEKQQKINFSEMKLRTWFSNGSTFESPEFKQKGKPYLINEEIKQKWLSSLPKPKVLSLTEKLKALLTPKLSIDDKRPRSFLYSEFEELDETEKENENTDLEGIEEEWIK
jgi:hypothetical protein